MLIGSAAKRHQEVAGVAVSTWWGVDREDAGAEWDTWTVGPYTACDTAGVYTGLLHLI